MQNSEPLPKLARTQDFNEAGIKLSDLKTSNASPAAAKASSAVARATAPAHETRVLDNHRLKILSSDYGRMPVNDLIKALHQTPGGPDMQIIYQAFALRKSEALPLVKQRLLSGEMYEKYMLTKMLRLNPWPETKEELLSLATSSKEKWMVRQGAVYALTELGDISVGPPIASMLSTETGMPSGAQGACIAALARLGYRDAAAIIQPYTASDVPFIRIWAARALTELGVSNDPTVFLEALESQDYVIRQEACAALHSFDNEDIKSLLNEKAKNDPNEAVRIAARQALIELNLANKSVPDKLVILSDALRSASKHEVGWLMRTIMLQCGNEGATYLTSLAANNDDLALRARSWLVFLNESRKP